jgi:hypothetical protein
MCALSAVNDTVGYARTNGRPDGNLSEPLFDSFGELGKERVEAEMKPQRQQIDDRHASLSINRHLLVLLDHPRQRLSTDILQGTSDIDRRLFITKTCLVLACTQ